MSGPFGYMAGLALLLVYVYASLAPFEWDRPQSVNNGATKSIQGVLFSTPGILLSPEPPQWLDDVIRSNQFSIRLRVSTASLTQRGPARIFTVSLDPYHRNLTIGQEGTSLVVRLRTVNTTLDGQPEYVISDVFTTLQQLVIELDVDHRALSLRINGKIAHVDALPSLPLANWDPTYRMGLGNELTGDRPWLGEIAQATFEVKGKSFDCVNGEKLERPGIYWPMPSWQRIISFLDVRAWQKTDVLLNMMCFVPLGFVLAFLQPTSKSFWLVIGFVAMLSLTVEVAQIGFAQRYSSAIDVMMNILGAAIGATLARRLAPGKASQKLPL
jgi:VanZ like family